MCQVCICARLVGRAAESSAKLNNFWKSVLVTLVSSKSRTLSSIKLLLLPSHIFQLFSIVINMRNMPGDSDLEVVPDGHGLQVADHYAGQRDPEVVQGQTSSNSRVSMDEPPLEVKANSPKSRRKIILKIRPIIGLVIVTLAIILGGVLGGVLGSRANSRSAPSEIANGTSATFTATGPKITSTSLPPKALTIHNKTNLAAIAWLNENVVHHRVYYQSAINEICESAWNSSSKSWYFQSNLGLAKNGTPISAIVAWSQEVKNPQNQRQMPFFLIADTVMKKGFIINLYFLHESGKVKELVSLDGLKWEAGSLSTKNVIPAPSSKLASTRAGNSNGGPESLLFVFQDDQNTFRLYNSTNSVWVDSKLPANPINASGVSLIRLTIKEYPDQLRLYYQTAAGNLVAADWVSLEQLQSAKASEFNCHVSSVSLSFSQSVDRF